MCSILICGGAETYNSGTLSVYIARPLKRYSMIESRQDYPFLTRLMIEMFNTGKLTRVTEMDIEAEFGYVGRLVYDDGVIRYFKGSNLDVNRHGSAEIVKDKGFAKYFMRRLGYETPQAQIFLAPLFFQRHKGNDATKSPELTLQGVYKYVADEIGYPCYIKPNGGAQGYGVYRCETKSEIDEALAWFDNAGYEVIIVEEAIHLPEYRIVVYKGEVICCYGRYPLSICGDGQSTARELLLAVDALYVRSGRPSAINLGDQRITIKLAQQQLTLDSVLEKDRQIQIFDSANLSIGGTAKNFTDDLHPAWKALAIEITRQFNLTLCGIDFCCADISNPESVYSILELNGSPILSGFASLGAQEYEMTRNLYRRILNREGESS